MNVVSFIYAFLLFFILTPGILLTLPKKGKKMMVASVHALIFAVVFTLTHHWIMKNTHFMFEGFKEANSKEETYKKMLTMKAPGTKSTSKSSGTTKNQ